MAKVWVLDTGTKGTGASIVPLEPAADERSGSAGLPYVPPKRAPRAPAPPAPKPPRRFKVVDAVSRSVLAEGADTRVTLALLGEQRSLVDVLVYVWQPEAGSWRLLTLGEQRTLWRNRTGARV